MMELLRSRRSIRKFINKRIEPEKIALLQEAALRSPTSRNRQPWEFIFTERTDVLKELSRCKPVGADFLAGCSLAVTICGDETRTDVWVEDCSIAATILQLTGQSIGLGSCWGQIRNRKHTETISAEKYVQDLLNLPANLRVEAIIGFGYPDEEKPGMPHESLNFRKIHGETYSDMP